MDAKLHWQSHINYLSTRARGRLGILKPLLHQKSSLSIQNGLTLYKTLILPIMTYACCIWGTIPKSKLDKLQIVQNVALRRATKSPWYVRNADIHRQSKIPRISGQILNTAQNFYKNLTKVNNPLVNSLGSYDESLPTKHKRPKAILARSCRISTKRKNRIE